MNIMSSKSKHTKFYKTSQFLKEQKKWYKKLKSNGFIDVDLYDSDQIQANHSAKPINDEILSDSIWETPQAIFYNQANDFLLSNDWSEYEKYEKTIWALFADGKTMRHIAKHVKKSIGTVHAVITKFKDKMKAQS